MLQRFFCLTALLLVATGCQSIKYSMWETVGVEKRDLLRSSVEDARDEQEQASEQFSSALDQLRTLYGDSGTDLEKAYDRLADVYEDSKDQAADVTARVKQMDRVADDLFEEWEQELDQYSSTRLRNDSARKLRDTQKQYAELSRNMHASARRMEPILDSLQDQVLYLKHNLNAQSLGTLKAEADAIRTDIQALIDDMNRAIADANAFIDTL